MKDIIAIVERMPTDGHSLKYADVADLLSRPRWAVCYEWLSLNARPYVSAGSQQLTALDAQKKDTLLEKLRMMQREIEQTEHDRTLNNQVLEDTLRNNKVTRRIAVWSLIVAIAALIVSIIVPCYSHSGFSSGEQQSIKNDSILVLKDSVLSGLEYTDEAPSLAKSFTLISDNSLSTRLICATLTFSNKIVAVSSSTTPLLKL